MKIRQIRNATIIVEYAGKKFLVDPWLQDKGKGIIAPSPDPEKNKIQTPIVDLPCSVEEILEGTDACIVTHIHPDHFTEEYIPKEMMIIVQNREDEEKLKNIGFLNINVFNDNRMIIGDISLTKAEGRHGENEQVAVMMGDVCGIVFEHSSEEKLYIVGDSVWYEGIEKNLTDHKPDCVVLNACDARIEGLGRLIMNKEDVLAVYKAIPTAKVIISHMDTVNHAFLSRKELKSYLAENGMIDRVLIPDDGESYVF
ncbi:MBL fold metallo-hydrolase [Clostridium sp. SHJSY1]|uniref:MBL fold metallo-hydrolase n=1 Tax=Clostridium sp. SHJSY1 TaxID=2942483 RepID=UPI00287457B7|nr:MBL fold metallo-hydrolase [Clostridium sp. SHJSY1]MDS0526690.1 MBL fold metallo-hydrolase [Clostridium sp. SHJSY1]